MVMSFVLEFEYLDFRISLMGEGFQEMSEFRI